MPALWGGTFLIFYVKVGISCLSFRPLNMVPMLHIQYVSLFKSCLSFATLSIAKISRKSRFSDFGCGDVQTCLETMHFVILHKLVSDLWFAQRSFKFFVDPTYSLSGWILHLRMYTTFFVVQVKCFFIFQYLPSQGDLKPFVSTPCRHVSQRFVYITLL